jgi:hypothetical protein
MAQLLSSGGGRRAQQFGGESVCEIALGMFQKVRVHKQCDGGVRVA